jgi:hypothetical protein
MVGPLEVHLISKEIISIGIHKIIKKIDAATMSKRRFILTNLFYNPYIFHFVTFDKVQFAYLSASDVHPALCLPVHT